MAEHSSDPPIVIVGAGAAGLLAAIHAASAGARVLVLESTRDGGRKILISGGGRCNVLPSEAAPERFVSDSSAHLVRQLLLAWPLAEQRRFFEDVAGIPLVLEAETGKLFPAGNRAREVRDGLVALARRAGAAFRFESRVSGLQPGPAGWQVQLAGGELLAARAVILATGGLSVPTTGSEGFGLDAARRLGHEVNPTYPALTPLTAEPAVHAALAGVSLPVTLEGRVQGRRHQAKGGFLFTHRGYSGPAVLDLSHLAVRSRLLGKERQRLVVSWSEVTEAGWLARLSERSSRTVASCVRDVLPTRLADRLMEEAGIPPARQLAQLRRDERVALIERLVRYPLPWTGDEGYRKAEVTGGGVALAEVERVTLESRRHPGLYFAGEILDAFGPIGGHNFCWAWATGRSAGLAAANATGRTRRPAP